MRTIRPNMIASATFFLMFGRHPPLSIDAYLCIDIETSEKSNSYDNHSKKLEKRLDFAYSIVFREVKLELYGINTVSRKVRQTSVHVGARVLIRNVSLKVELNVAELKRKDLSGQRKYSFDCKSLIQSSNPENVFFQKEVNFLGHIFSENLTQGAYFL